jgi:hypothetical protein
VPPPEMPMPKLTSTLLSAFMVTACVGATMTTMTACDKSGGGSSKKKSERLRWVNKPTTGSSEDEGKLITIPGLNVWFHVPDVLYVYKNCVEASHVPEGPDKAWVPVIRCTSPFANAGSTGGDWDDDDDDDAGGGDMVMTIFVAERGSMVLNERSKTSYTAQYRDAGFEVNSIEYYDEYMSKRGRRGLEILVHTVDSSTGYPDREIRRFMFPKDDVVFIAHVDYPYSADRSGINNDWERILWGFQLFEDGELYK